MCLFSLLISNNNQLQYWKKQFLNVKVKSLSGEYPTLCDPMDCSLLRSAIHGILQARVLVWVAISFSRGSSQTRD